MAEVKWIKITTDIFDDEKILLIESMPDAYAIITCWFKLLCLAGKQNNSGVFMMGQIAYTDKMLATIFRMKESTVQLALQTFEQFGMVEIVDGVITIPNWEKHQNLDKLEQAKEQTRLRVARHREKQKLLAECNVTCNATVTESNADRTDIEEDKDIEEEKESIPYISIVGYLNERAGTRYKASGEKTRKAIHARFSEGFTEEDFRCVIDKKCAEWIGTEWEKFLRPETLFGTKFESYLNARVTKGKQQTETANPRTANDDFMERLMALHTPVGNNG